MAKVRITLVDHLRGQKTKVEVPDNVPMNRLVPALAARLGLPTDQDGQPVTYRLDNRETEQRIGDDQTLAEAGVTDGAILALFPEVTAGSPRMRARRLHAERERLQELHERNGLVRIVEALGDPPDRYIVEFTCRGIAEVSGDEPVYSTQHRVAIQLTTTFPTEQPLMRWLTPIFHPNIRQDGDAVCIGAWYPAKTLDQLVLMLGEMVQYKNYASYDPLNLDASLWAMHHKQYLPVDARDLLDPNRPPREHSRRGDDLDILLLE